MDETRFDTLTKTLAAGTGRRAVLKRLGLGLGSALLGGALLPEVAGAAGKGGGCNGPGGFGECCTTRHPCADDFICRGTNHGGQHGTCGCRADEHYCPSAKTCFDRSIGCP